MLIFNKRKKFIKKRENVVELKKPNTKARRILRIVEITLIIFVVLSTIFGLVSISRLSPLDFWDEHFSRISPKILEPNAPAIRNDRSDQIIRNLPKEIFTFKAVEKKTDTDLVITSQQGTIASFSLTKNLDFQLTTLQNILTKAKINKRKVGKVDLRFDKVAVVYKK